MGLFDSKTRLVRQRDEARKQKNEAERKLRELRNNAIRALEKQGYAVIPRDEFDSVAERAKRAERDKRNLQQLQEFVVPREEYEALQRELERRLEESGAKYNELQAQYKALQRQLHQQTSMLGQLSGQLRQMVPRGEMERQLESMVPREEYQALQGELARTLDEQKRLEEQMQQQLADNESIVARLQSELLESQAQTAEIGRQYAQLRMQLIGIASRSKYRVGEAGTIAIVAREPEGIIASAQLKRAGIEIGYISPENCYKFVSSIKSANEVIIAGISLDDDDTIEKLRTLHTRGCKITLIGSYDGIGFADIFDHGTVAESLSAYLKLTRHDDPVYQRLLAMGDEEARYIGDAFSLNPLDSGFRDAMVRQLSQHGTLEDSTIYPGVMKKAGAYNFLHSRGLL